jgi:hypothetical protein
MPRVDSVLQMREFVHDWKISKQFTLDVANSMPAEFYGFKPNPEEMSFGEQMGHIADSSVFRFEQITGIKTPYVLDFSKPLPSDKNAVIKRLEMSFDYVIAVLPQITPEQLTRTWHIESWKGRTEPDWTSHDLEYVRPHGASPRTVRGVLTRQENQTSKLHFLVGICRVARTKSRR